MPKPLPICITGVLVLSTLVVNSQRCPTFKKLKPDSTKSLLEIAPFNPENSQKRFYVLSEPKVPGKLLKTTDLVSQVREERKRSIERPDCRETNPLNKENVTEAYPFISADGLRLYFTSNQEGGHGRLYISSRKSLSDPFGEPVILGSNLTDGYFAGTLTADELTLCMSNRGTIYISTRKDRLSEFEAPVKVAGIPDIYHTGPAISPDGNSIIAKVEKNRSQFFRVYKKIAGYRFEESGVLPEALGYGIGPGQFSKDGLLFYFSLEDEEGGSSLGRYSRQSLTTDFGSPEMLSEEVNGFKRNFQPSVNEDASIIVYVTSQNNRWEEDDLVLFNNPREDLFTQGLLAKTIPEIIDEAVVLTPIEDIAGKGVANIDETKTKTLSEKRSYSIISTRAFPNPFIDNIVFQLKEMPTNGTQLLLYNATGSLIKQVRIVGSRTQINLPGLAAGSYSYQVIDGRKNLVASGILVKAR